jgi:hypothetical protein
MLSLPKLIPTDERTRCLVALVRAAQTTLAGLENPIARVWPDVKDKGEYHECHTPSTSRDSLLGVVDVDEFANLLRDALKDYDEIPVRFQPTPRPAPSASTALAHLSTVEQPPSSKPHDTVRLLEDDKYRNIKAGEIGTVTNVLPCGKWIEVRWRNYPAHEVLVKISQVERVRNA